MSEPGVAPTSGTTHRTRYEMLRAARDQLLGWRGDYPTALANFAWPQFTEFNFALDWFDQLAVEHPADPALWIVDTEGGENRYSYAELARRSNQVANWLRAQGVGRGDRVAVMLGNQVELWEALLALMKLGAVVIPCTPLLAAGDLADRIVRGQVRHLLTTADSTGKVRADADLTRIVVGAAANPSGRAPDGWLDYADAATAATNFEPDGVTPANDTLLLYFTSGTTSRPKLVEHTQVSYPVGHLTTMYWIGLEPGDIHLNSSSPGWAKHAWTNLFAPWLAEACVFIYNSPRFEPAALLQVMQEYGVSSFCAPPTVWRMLIQADLSALKTPPRKAAAAGEPLNPEVIERVRQAWGVTVRDGFGQTETTAMVANLLGEQLVPGAMGRPMPGYPVVLVDPVDGQVKLGAGAEGEVCLDLARRPLGLMAGYLGDAELTATAMRDGYYHTGDIASRDEHGFLTYVGRADDVFKASDYRVSPFELESVLIEHPAVAEAAVVPSPDPVRLAVPKAFVVLTAGHKPDADTARSIFAYCREHLSPFLRIRRLEFAELPKTTSGKIRRVDLRTGDAARHPSGTERATGEFWEEDLR